MLLSADRYRAGFSVRRAIMTALLSAAVVAIGACERSGMTGSGTKRTGSSGQEVVRITGSSTIAPLVAKLASVYEREHPGVRIDVETGGSSRGIADVRRGLADIGMVSRSLGEGENDLDGRTIARDGVAVVVHASNPIAGLSAEQVRSIFTGRVSNWSEIGGEDRAIVVVHKADGRSTQEVFLEHFRLAPGEIRPSAVIGDNAQGIKTIAGSRGAVGYISIGAVERSAEGGEPVRTVPIDGIEATTKSLRSGEHPIARDLLLVTHGAVSPEADRFIEFTRSARAARYIDGFSFVQADE